MNHTGVTHHCIRCHSPATVFMRGDALCSRHALDTMRGRLTITVDLRNDPPRVAIDTAKDAHTVAVVR